MVSASDTSDRESESKDPWTGAEELVDAKDASEPLKEEAGGLIRHQTPSTAVQLYSEIIQSSVTVYSVVAFV